MDNWFTIKNTEELLSPGLFFYPDRIWQNIQKMIDVAGDVNRLRPHVKTYKCREIVQMQLEAGIQKFKCATLMEARLLAEVGVKDILIAYPFIGPNQQKFLELKREFTTTIFSVLLDHCIQIESWVKQKIQAPLDVFIDLDVGMHRTGIHPTKAAELYHLLDHNVFQFRGWHVYDGHIHHENLAKRIQATEKAFSSVATLLEKVQHPTSIEIICGGSLTFPIHAMHENRYLSPGTTLLWDYGYASSFPDLSFEFAAILFTRVISKPKKEIICLDLGYKAVAAEMEVIPVHFPQIPNVQLVGHSEEHLVLKTPFANEWQIGDVLYGIPYHICPTVALHEEVGIIENRELVKFWKIEARKRAYKL